MRYDKKACRKCGGIEIIKWGRYRGKQCYRCKYCGTVFTLQKRWVEEAYEAYSIRGHSYEDISLEYGKSIRGVQKAFDKIKTQQICNILKDQEVNLCLDGVYFGWSLCYIVLRANGRNIYFRQCSETIENIAKCLRDASSLGYSYKSFTIDGRKGVIAMLEQEYPGIPIQYCQFHQRKTIRRYLTKEPKTDCGRELNRLLDKITQYTKEEFTVGLEALESKYAEFLAQRNEQKRYMHRKLRSAFRSLKRNLPYLFTYREERYRHLNIPNTTNTCEGYFSHLKTKVRVHPGLRKHRKQKLIEKILVES